MKHSDIDIDTVTLHVVEHGRGPAVLFCHGFPDVWRGWRRQMEVTADHGYRAIALDMRGYGRSSAPADATAYTPFHTVGDLVGVLDALNVTEVTIVGHDFGASTAWVAALLRPDRFTAVFCASVPFTPLGGRSFLRDIAESGARGFYMFDQMRTNAPQRWADAAVTYPSFLYHSSGSAPAQERWDPFAGGADMVRPASVHIPPWADEQDTAYAIAEFQRTGFEAPLNYYRSIQPFYDLSQAFRGLTVRQPSYYLTGEVDALYKMQPLDERELQASLPGLRGAQVVPGVGHWPNREVPDIFNAALLDFLASL
jgi:pimeloyl-ACP methyl ester carboxylesterase